MNASSYLQSFGWQEGQALQKGGLRKPILVKHKKDNKGLGSEVNDADMWWERLFDGQLKSLEVTSGSNGVSVKQNEKEVADHMRKANSPLYRMFVRGEGLAGTVGKTENALVKSITIEATEVFDNVTRSVDSLKSGRKEKSKKNSEKEKKEKKMKEDKKDKKDKKTKEDKKDKKSKLETRDKKEKSGKKEKEDKKEKRVSKEEKCLKEKKDQKDKKDKKDKKSRKNKATELASVDKADKNAKKERKSKKRQLDDEKKPSKRSKTS
ncbi:hypothetical protein OXX59_002173 [Metschnikowia pulcherrima]